MIDVIFSAYFCNPYWPSESYGAFKWMETMLDKANVKVFTSKGSEEGILKYYNNQLPDNLKVYTFEDDNYLKKKLKIQLHFGYFTFNKNVEKFLKSNSEELKNVKFILHKNPSSFRYFTCLHKHGAPLVVGPLGGGLQVPPVLKDYFESESFVNKLRKYDKFLLKLPVYRKQYKAADKILLTFNYIKNTLPKEFHHKTQEFFDIGIEVDNQLPQRAPIKNNEPVRLLYVGKLIRYKGAELAIRAVALLNDHNIHFDIVGDGVEKKFLENLTKELELTDRVTIHGLIPFEKVGEFYLNSHIFCFPTLTEAGGGVFLEAMKFGLPILSVNNGGPKYIIPNEGGIKVAIDNKEMMIDQIAESLIPMINSEGLRRKMGEANYKHVKATYSWEAQRDNIYRLIENYEAKDHA